MSNRWPDRQPDLLEIRPHSQLSSGSSSSFRLGRRARAWLTSGPRSLVHMPKQQSEDLDFQALVSRITPSSPVSSLRSVTERVQAHLAPVLTAGDISSSDQSLLARTYAKSLVLLIRLVFGSLNQSTLPAAVAPLSELAATGLQGLSKLRGVLRGRLYETEVQRYTLVKRLNGMQQHAEASRQAVLTLQSISDHWPSKSHSPVPANSKELPALSHLDTKTASPEQAVIVLGTVLQLYTCVVADPAIRASIQVAALVKTTWAALCWLRCTP